MKNMLNFFKYHGLGNDFIIIDFPGEGIDLNALARHLCNRRLGIGADGLITYSQTNDQPHMRIFNADGTEAEMCGNGFRCFIHYLYQHKGFSREEISVQTLNGWLTGQVLEEEKNSVRVSSNLGVPEFDPALIPVDFSGERFIQEKVELENREFTISVVRTGPPHAVLFLKPGEELDPKYWGPRLEQHPVFPRGANINFSRILSPDRAQVVVWERGVGLTRACGTGAAAVGVIGHLLGKMEPEVIIELPGGELEIRWDGWGQPAFMTGNSEAVFSGALELNP